MFKFPFLICGEACNNGLAHEKVRFIVGPRKHKKTYLEKVFCEKLNFGIG